SSRRRHTRSYGDWSSDVCSSDLPEKHLAVSSRILFLAVRLERNKCWKVFALAIISGYGNTSDLEQPCRKACLVGSSQLADAFDRSEERRVGKECRCGGGADR